MVMVEIFLPIRCFECNSADVKVFDHSGIEFMYQCNSCEHKGKYIMNL